MLQDPNIQQNNNPELKNVQVHGFAPPSTQEIENNNQPQEKVVKTSKFSVTFFKWWHIVALFFLTVNGLIGLWESIKFILIDLKDMEQQLTLHQIKVDEVNELIVMAVVVAFTTLISFLMAIRLRKAKESTAQTIDLVMATFIIIGTKYIRTILLRFDLLASITKIFFK